MVSFGQKFGDFEMSIVHTSGGKYIFADCFFKKFKFGGNVHCGRKYLIGWKYLILP